MARKRSVLVHGSSPRSIRRNIGRLKSRGVPRQQAIGISLSQAEKARREKARRRRRES